MGSILEEFPLNNVTTEEKEISNCRPHDHYITDHAGMG
jgi:hypothetical protein